MRSAIVRSPVFRIGHGIRFNPESIQRVVAWAVGRIFDWQRPDGNRNVPYLNDWDDKRKLNLNSFENDWNENYRFAAVRNWIYSALNSDGGFFIPQFTV